MGIPCSYGDIGLLPFQASVRVPDLRTPAHKSLKPKKLPLLLPPPPQHGLCPPDQAQDLWLPYPGPQITRP